MSIKIAVITGGTKGIGKALVERFITEGFTVVTCARNLEELENLKKKHSFGSKAVLHTYQVDVSKKEEVLQFAKRCLEEAGVPDVLINNAGIFLPGQIHQEEDLVLETLLSTNLASAYHLTRGLMNNMMDRKTGHIFNICSTASIMAYTNGGSYCISKFALYGMTKVLREELKPHGIKVTAVIPGATLTASWEGVELPPERFMPAEDIAAAVWSAYKLSPQTVLEELIIRPQLGDIG
jgi:short-subunit dehydrogenase